MNVNNILLLCIYIYKGYNVVIIHTMLCMKWKFKRKGDILSNEEDPNLLSYGCTTHVILLSINPDISH